MNKLRSHFAEMRKRLNQRTSNFDAEAKAVEFAEAYPRVPTSRKHPRKKPVHGPLKPARQQFEDFLCIAVHKPASTDATTIDWLHAILHALYNAGVPTLTIRLTERGLMITVTQRQDVYQRAKYWCSRAAFDSLCQMPDLLSLTFQLRFSWEKNALGATFYAPRTNKAINISDDKKQTLTGLHQILCMNLGRSYAEYLERDYTDVLEFQRRLSKAYQQHKT